MADKKVYTIVINGITESVDAVDSLLKKLDNLEERINALNQKGIKVEGSGGSSGGGSKSRVSDLTAEQKIIDQINRSQEKREVLEGEIGKKLADEKQAMKELNAEQKSLAAMDRIEKSGILNGGDLPKTMLGMKSELADIKAAMQSMEVGSDEFLKATQRANELNDALKKIEETYGQYGRNVGNYAGSIADALGAMDGITIKIGEQEVKFNSTKEAMRTMKENLKQMTVEGKQGEKAYDDTIKALHELEMALQEADSAINDVKTSSQGMDTALDWMQSFGAMGQITQGFSAFFGNTGFEESIQKLMSLQSMLQGLEQLRKQMNTGEGFGGMFKSMSQGADEAAAKMLRVKGGMEGLGNASKATQIAVKGLSTVMKGLAGLGIGLLIDGAMKLADKVGSLINGWIGGNDAVIDSNKAVAASIEFENKRLEEQERQLKKNFAEGKINSQQLYEETVKAQRDAFENALDELDEFIGKSDEISNKIRDRLQGIQKGKGIGTEWYTPRIEINDIEEGEKEFEKWDAAVTKHITIWDEMLARGDEGVQYYAKGARELATSVEDTQQELQAINAVGFGELRKKFREAIEAMKEDTDKGIAKINELYKELTSSKWLSSVLNNPSNLIDVQGFATLVNQVKQMFYGLYNTAQQAPNDPFALRELEASTLTGVAKRNEQIKIANDRLREQWAGNAEALKMIDQKEANELAEAQKQSGAARVKTAKATAKQTLDVEKEKSRLEIELMSEGLKKRIAQLNKQRDEELKKVKGHKELELRVNQLYDKKIVEERKKYADETKKIYEDLYRNILDMTINNLQGQLDLMDDELDDRLKRMYDRRPITIFSGVSEMFTGSLDSEQMNWVNEFSALLKQSDEFTSKLQNAFNKGLDTTEIQNQLDAVDKRLMDLQKKYDEKGWRKVFGLDSHEIVTYFRNFDSTFQESTDSFVDYMNKTKAFWNNYINQIKKNIGDEYETRQSLIKKNREKEENDNKTWRKEQIEKLNEHHRNLEQDDKRSAMQRQMDTVQYNLDLQKIIIAAKIQQKQIEEKYNREREETNREYNAKINEQTKEANAKRLNDDIRSLQSYSQIVSDNLQYQPVKNEFGFMQVAKTNKVLRETLEGLLILRQKIIETRDEATRMWDAGDLSTDEYNNALSDLKNQMDGLEKKIKEVQDGLSWEGKLQDFFQNLQQYYSAISDSFQTILSEFQNNQDYMIERQMDALDKENEELQKKLDENEKILERHKNNVEKIEGELADARGDRRERLIDALNQEIIAQRRAQAEKEKLEKEQEKIEERQKELEKKQKEYEYQRGLQQILFQTSQAVMQAATNNWPIPAIPLMALAAATGATQYALARQRKPYAEGGILDGLSHENGGISVGNSNIEVEGGEYVVNKRSTANNTELLNLINNSDRQLTPSDLMNFATNMSVSPLDVNMPESSSLETAFVAYAQRPIVVDVREITSRQESVRNVQVLSGIR